MVLWKKIEDLLLVGRVLEENTMNFFSSQDFIALGSIVRYLQQKSTIGIFLSLSEHILQSYVYIYNWTSSKASCTARPCKLAKRTLKHAAQTHTQAYARYLV